MRKKRQEIETLKKSGDKGKEGMRKSGVKQR